MVGTLVKHHCLCGAIHVRAGARILSIMYLVAGSVNLLNSLGFISGYPGSPITSFVAFVVAFTLTYGVFKERRYFLIPFLLIKVFTIVVISFGLLLWMALLLAYSNRIPDFALSAAQNFLPIETVYDDWTLRTSCTALSLAILVVFMTYIYLVFADYYVFLKEREEAFLNDSDHSMQYTPVSPHDI
uniref:MnhB domain-containing protein n=1 Tax=Haemonchus contortus TaxID=6289 RepID=A0A7I4YQF6_HAECO